MNLLKSIQSILKYLQDVAARRLSPSGALRADGEGEGALPGTAALCERMEKLREMRAVHAELVSQRMQVSAEVDALASQLSSATEALSMREREIAIAGTSLPDEPLPEENEVNRLKRHLRILQARVVEWDRKVAEDDQKLQSQARGVTDAWDELRASVDQMLYERWCAAALGMRDTWLLVIAFARCFSGQSIPRWRWNFMNQQFIICDLRDGSKILDPRLSAYPEKWPPAATAFMGELQALQAEIRSVTGASVFAANEQPEGED
jgi:hypothetical protein